ncbi:MAG: helix-turn-helix transcriptional regulator [Nitrospinae bacterium]|nr:helix-turn-helix transcriptional regulator [Nitrospinota bacterium]
MNKPQVILDEGGRPAFAVIPWREYERLANGEAEALLSDEALYDRAAAEGGESFPARVADRLLAGENPVRVYRTHRGMKQGDLAAAAGIHPVYLSQIETGKRTGSAKTLAAIAGALGVAVDDLI